MVLHHSIFNAFLVKLIHHNKLYISQEQRVLKSSELIERLAAFNQFLVSIRSNMPLLDDFLDGCF